MQLPVQTLHLVFTLPHEFNPLILANQTLLIGLFLTAVKNTLTRTLRDDFQCQAGLIQVLHTWGQRMNMHIHCHVLVFAGGPSLDESHWVTIPTDVPHPICPLRLAESFRKRFLRRLRWEYKRRNLALPDALRQLDSLAKFNQWLKPIRQKLWKVHSQKPPAHCHDATAAIKYLSHYMTGTAIGNHRILADDGEYVTIRVKSYRKKCHEELRLHGEEFVRRFVQHILPPRCMRVRYAGFLAGSHREEKLALCRRLLGVTDRGDEEELLEGEEDGEESFGGDSDRFVREDRARFPLRCPRCGRPEMQSLGHFDGFATAQLLAERIAFWERVHTVASTFENLPFEYPFELPLPET